MTLVSPDQVPGNQDTTLQSVFSANWVSLSGSFAGAVCQGVQVKDRMNYRIPRDK